MKTLKMSFANAKQLSKAEMKQIMAGSGSHWRPTGWTCGTYGDSFCQNFNPCYVCGSNHGLDGQCYDWCNYA